MDSKSQLTKKGGGPANKWRDGKVPPRVVVEHPMRIPAQAEVNEELCAPKGGDLLGTIQTWNGVRTAVGGGKGRMGASLSEILGSTLGPTHSVLYRGLGLGLGGAADDEAAAAAGKGTHHGAPLGPVFSFIDRRIGHSALTKQKTFNHAHTHK